MSYSIFSKIISLTLRMVNGGITRDAFSPKVAATGSSSTDLIALVKEELDRKTKHQGLMKAETQPRPARPPLWRDKLQRDIPHDWRRYATEVVSLLWLATLCKGTRLQAKKE